MGVATPVATPAMIETAILPATLEFFGHIFLSIGQNSRLTVPGHLFLLLLRPHSLLSAKLATYLLPQSVQEQHCLTARPSCDLTSAKLVRQSGEMRVMASRAWRRSAAVMAPVGRELDSVVAGGNRRVGRVAGGPLPFGASDHAGARLLELLHLPEQHLCGACLLVRGIAELRGVTPPRQLAIWRGAAVVCTTMTGVVYTVLLRGVATIDAPSANDILPYVFPAIMLADWFRVRPGSRITYKWRSGGPRSPAT